MTLREFRQQNNLSLATFASMIGRTAATVSRIERGIDRPGWETLDRIEEATGGLVTRADIASVAA